MRDSTPGQRCTRRGAVNLTGGRASYGGRRTRWGAVHPMGSSTPDGEQYTRTERVQCIPIGCRALTNKHNRGTLSLAARRMSLGGARGAVAAGWTVCGACGCDGSWGIGVDRCATRAMPRGVSAWVAVCAGAMAAPPRALRPRWVDRGAAYVTSSVVGYRRGSRGYICVAERGVSARITALRVRQ